jgi:hypothetical protein
MKYARMILAIAVVGMASCSSPTGPRYPQPEEDSRIPEPDNPGLVAMQGAQAVTYQALSA